MPATLQKWAFNVDAPYDKNSFDYYTYTNSKFCRVIWQDGDTIDDTITVETIIEDIIGTPTAVGYTNLKLVTYLSDDPIIDIIMSSDIVDDYVNIFSGETSFIPYKNGMKGKMRYSIQNQASITPGESFQCTGIHIIRGTNSSNVEVDLVTKTFVLEMHKHAAPAIYTNPDVIAFTHYIGDALPSPRDFSVLVGNSNSWTLETDANFPLTSDDVDVTIDIDTGTSAYRAVSNENRQLAIALGNYYKTLNTPQHLQYPFNVTQSGSTAYPLYINVSIENKIRNIFFFAVKDFSEPVAQDISFEASDDFTTSAPSWLIVTPTFDSGILTLNIVPVPTSTMALGSYTDTVTLVYTIDSIDFTMYITVYYELEDYILSPYIVGAKAFTLDTKYFQLQSANTDTYFQFNANIKAYDFFTNALQEYIVAQKIVLFQGKSKINLGQVIHRLMDRFLEINDTNFQYKLAILNVDFQERFISDDSINRSGTSIDIPFVAGLSRGITAIGILDFNLKPNRVTKNSFAFINLLVPAGEFEMQVFKNGTQIDTVELTEAIDTILCQKVFFDTYQKGDIIDYYLIDVGGTSSGATPKKTFIVFPENYYSNMIVWENEFLLQSALECTGSCSIKSELEFQSQKIYDDFVEKLVYLSSTKDTKFTINTGWLMVSDIDSIESLMRTKRAWLVQNSTTIDIVPIGKSILNSDSERELIEFTLEFQINRKYNEETYSL